MRVILITLLFIALALGQATAPIVVGGTQASAYVLLGKKAAANFNVTTDQAISITGAKYVIRRIIVTNASASLTTAAGGIYAAASKATTLVDAAQVYTALTATTKYLDLTLNELVGTDVRTESMLYLSLTTSQGSTATADVYVFGELLP